MGFREWWAERRERRIFKTCKSIYEKARAERPGKPERDYLKIVLITKPPFDYQHDKIIDITLDSCTDVEGLAQRIAELSSDSNLWESRERNVKRYKEELDSRNREFFTRFWSM